MSYLFFLSEVLKYLDWILPNVKGGEVTEDFEHLLFVTDCAYVVGASWLCLMSFTDTKWACAFIILPILEQMKTWC